MGSPRTVSKTKSNRVKYDQLNIRIKKDGGDDVTLEDIRQAAELCNESINAFVLQAIKDRTYQATRW